jgi:hypothetical protein
MQATNQAGLKGLALKGLANCAPWSSSNDLNDAGLAHVKQLSGLEFLNLLDAEITDAGLAHLKEMINLMSWYWKTRRSAMPAWPTSRA